jgi:fucose permease
MTTAKSHANLFVIRALTYMMFMMFAMTTDSVGSIIPEVVKTFHLSMTAAGAFHYANMIAIAVAAIGLGFLADRLGRKPAIVLGLILFALNSFLFAFARSYGIFVILLIVSGVSIGIFKSGALALIGDIASSTREHTSIMNNVEGFFGIGAIIGPFIVARLLAAHVSWDRLYLIAGAICVLLILVALFVRYPRPVKISQKKPDLLHTLSLLKSPFVLGFSLACFLYVSVECAIYVWLPAFLKENPPSSAFLAAYVVSIFFILRAGGRFLGAWVTARWNWTTVLMVFSLAIMLCFLGSLCGGVNAAVYLLALSGLFMSVIYPTLNSKGISCFPKSEHGSVAGIILFFTCAGAALGPLAMGLISDLCGSLKYGFILATAFSVLLFLGLFYNWKANPTSALLKSLDDSEYRAEDQPHSRG